MDDCNCKSNDCIKCIKDQLEKAKQKNDKYKKILDELMDDSIMQDVNDRSRDGFSNSNLYESVIVTKNIDGNFIKKHNSNLGESYMIMDKGKDIEELTVVDRKILTAQDDLKNYETITNYTQKGTYLYGIFNVASKFTGLFIGF